jgi:hypothetical protein
VCLQDKIFRDSLSHEQTEFACVQTGLAIIFADLRGGAPPIVTPRHLLRRRLLDKAPHFRSKPRWFVQKHKMG